MNYIRRTLPIIWLLFLLLALTSCELFPKEEEVLAPPLMEPVKISYNTVKATRGDLEHTISGSGSFISFSEKDIFFENRGGRLLDIYVDLGDEVRKGDLLAELYTDNIEHDIEQQELNLRKAQINYNKVKASDGDKYSLELASIDIEQARLELEQLKNEQSEAKIVSDVDGIITYIDKRLRTGDNISAYQNIMTIADPHKLILEYSGTGLSDFVVGNEVNVTINENNYVGEVISTPSSVPVDGDEQLSNVVLIDVKDIPDNIEMGDKAQISLILEKSEDVIILPKQAIKTYMGRKYVNVLEDGLNNERDVEVGIETSTKVEILSGVEEGEEIILR